MKKSSWGQASVLIQELFYSNLTDRKVKIGSALSTVASVVSYLFQRKNNFMVLLNRVLHFNTWKNAHSCLLIT